MTTLHRACWLRRLLRSLQRSVALISIVCGRFGCGVAGQQFGLIIRSESFRTVWARLQVAALTQPIGQPLGAPALSHFRTAHERNNVHS